MTTRNLLLIFSLFCFAACQSGRNRLASEIAEKEGRLFSDSLHQLNTTLAEEQVANYRVFAEKYPADSLSPEYLFKAADLANGLGRGRDAISMLRQLCASYPSHARAETGLFMQGFIYETTLQRPDSAIMAYTEYLKKYPGHQLSQAAEFSLMQLKSGMSAEDVVRMFESRNDSLAAAAQ